MALDGARGRRGSQAGGVGGQEGGAEGGAGARGRGARQGGRCAAASRLAMPRPPPRRWAEMRCMSHAGRGGGGTRLVQPALGAPGHHVHVVLVAQHTYSRGWRGAHGEHGGQRGDEQRSQSTAKAGSTAPRRSIAAIRSSYIISSGHFLVAALAAALATSGRRRGTTAIRRG